MRACVGLEPYLLGELDPEGTRKFESHLASCSSCSNEVDRFQVIRNGVREWAKTNPAPRADTFKAQRLIRTAASEVRPPGRVRLVAVTSFACACLLALGLVSQRFSQGGGETVAKLALSNDTLAAVDVLHSHEASVDSQPNKGVHRLVSSKSGALVVDTRGARLALGPNSRVRVVADDHLRLQLVQGTVAIQADKRPSEDALVVESDGYEVRVVGTRFQVSRGAAVHLAVSVTEGKVETRSPSGGRYDVPAGDVLSFVGNRPPTRRDVQKDEVAEIDGLIEWDRIEEPVSADRVRRQPRRVVSKAARKAATPDDESTPESHRGGLATWRAWVVAGRYQQAEQALLGHLEANPKETGAWQLLGSLYRKTRAWDKALEAHSRVIEYGGAKDANRARFLAAVIVQDRQKKPRRAVAFLEEYLRRSSAEKPLESQAMLRLGKAYQDVGDRQKASQVFGEIISRFPGTAETAEAKRLSEER